MKKNNYILVLLPLTILLYGCPYYSKVPLSGKPTIEIDRGLLGTWVGISESGEVDTTMSLVIYALTRKEYLIAVASRERGFIDVNCYKAFSTLVSDKLFVNFKSLENKSDYNFLVYQLKGDTLKAKVVSDLTIKDSYTKPKDLTKVFANSYTGKDFFEQELVFARKK